MPIPLASHSISKVLVKSGNARRGASVSLFLSSSKAFYCALPHTKTQDIYFEPRKKVCVISRQGIRYHIFFALLVFDNVRKKTP